MVAKRCIWADVNPLYVKYHDEEWGVPLRDNDSKLFEALILELMQAGFSRLMVLQKRENFHKAFDHFDPAKVALYSEEDVARLVSDKGIIRHQPKIKASIANAQAFVRVIEEFGSFGVYIWRFVNGNPIQNSRMSLNEIPKTIEEAIAMSKDLSKRKFKLVNPELCYSYMQAIGMVNDHTVDCFRYEELSRS